MQCFKLMSILLLTLSFGEGKKLSILSHTVTGIIHHPTHTLFM